MLNKKALAAAVSTVPVYVEDVFSTYLYAGTGAALTITNGLDLSGSGGLVWTKPRNSSSTSNSHILTDTVRGAYKQLFTDTTGAQYNPGAYGVSFGSSGFSLTASDVGNNSSSDIYASWTFRKQPKFFDIVTYTGNGTAGRTVSHNLGSVPGCIIVKRTDAANGWAVYHRSMNASPQDYMMRLNATDAAFTTSPSRWNNTLPTSTVFTLSGNDEVNGSGGTYVAYLFAHDAGGFGTSGSDNVISCGSVVIGSGGQASVTLGYEPQWILYKTTTTAQEWYVYDVMRGMPVGTASGPYSRYLNPNSSAAEGDGASFALTPTGFDIKTSIANATYIYIAIRRGPMKTPTTGTSVYQGTTRSGTGAAASISGLAFPPDAVWAKGRTPAGVTPVAYDKLRGPLKALFQSDSYSEASATDSLLSFNQDGVSLGADALYGSINYGVGYTYANWAFRRAPGFFDVVCYTGTGASTEFVYHNLGVSPELVIIKRRNSTSDWMVNTLSGGAIVYSLGLNSTSADNATNFQGTAYSASTYIGVRTGTTLANISGATYVAYLFATVAGVSKVGSYTGNGSNQTIDCGFAAGSRFVMIKRTDSTGDWYVWDSARGIVAGNDPHLSLNTTAAEVTTDDSVDTDNSGFIVNQLAATNINVSSATYIFLSVA